MNDVVELHPYIPINCDDYEYIELVCMHHYQLDVITPHKTISGLAVTTQTNRGGEFLIIEFDNGTHESVRVDRIQKLVVHSGNRQFDEKTFSSANR